MKRSRLFLVLPLVIASSAFTSHANAANEVGLGVTYDPRLPVGSFRDFTGSIAAMGIQAKWDYFPIDALSIGLEMQYQLFQRDTETSTTPIANGAVTAPTFRYASIFSFLPTARYYFSDQTLRPYVALGAGITDTTNAVLVSDLGRRENSLGFIVQPSVGLLWRLWSDSSQTPRVGGTTEETYPPNSSFIRRPLDRMFGLTASLTYAFTTTDVAGASNVMFAGIQLGIYAKP